MKPVNFHSQAVQSVHVEPAISTRNFFSERSFKETSAAAAAASESNFSAEAVSVASGSVVWSLQSQRMPRSYSWNFSANVFTKNTILQEVLLFKQLHHFNHHLL